MNRTTRFFALAGAFGMTLAILTSPVSAQCTAPSDTALMMTGDECAAEGKDLVATAIGADDFNTLVAAVKAAGLVEALQGDGPFTIFAPTDAAFARLPKGTLESLLEPKNRAQLTSILTFHVVPGRVMAKDVVKLTGATTLEGQRLNIAVTDAGVTVDGISVVKTDVVASNGVIHVIDGVLMPVSKNIVEVATEAGQFQTLLTAAKAAGLVPALTGKGPLTVFAPTDAAFAALPKGTVASLLEPGNRETLAAILKLHVVSGRIYSPDAIAAGRATALSGGSLEITEKNGIVRVNGAQVKIADLDASNGVVHVIDRVLLP